MVEATVPASPSGHPTAAARSSSAAPTVSPNPTPTPPAPSYRPSPVRSFTVSNPYSASAKGRTASQPPGGDRLPSSSPASGRGSPGMNGGEYGVIGGSRTPTSGRLSSSGMQPPVPVTRASSFSVADKVDQKPSSLVRTLSSHLEERPSSRPASPSAFPTFSPSSSPSNSPSMPSNLPLPVGQYSPPVAPANVSRSRSQSMATGVRPDRIMPLTTFEYSRFEETWHNDASNMSPFANSGRSFFDDDGTPTRSQPGVATSFRTPQEATFRSRGWGSPTTTALTTSVTNALGSHPTYSSVVGGFDDAANGGRSGTSSRRHSVSVVGGPRRGFSFNDSAPQGMTAIPGRRGVGPLGFTDDELLPERFVNALSISVDDKERVPADETDQVASSLPIFSPAEASRSLRRSVPSAEAFFGSSPVAEKQERGRFGFADTRSRSSFSVGAGGSPPDKPGPVGTPLRAPNAGGLPPIGNYDGRFAGAPAPASPERFRGSFNAPPSGPGAAAFGRPPANSGGFAYFGGGGQPAPARPQFAQNGSGFGGIGLGFGPPYPVPQALPANQPPRAGFGSPNYFGAQQQPPAPAPTSPSSFSSLSLADLGKGIPLASLPPTTPLYIVTFKAGRRDVFYCPDPTLLISNGDRVIVEADRGSDLGTVVYDQLTPVEVREWQERQATAALLSGASQHQPPGMAMTGSSSAPASGTTAAHTRNGSQQPRPPAPGALDFTGADLNTLLSGVGPSGSQMDMGGGGIGARGPLAKEIMPKRIFTKSSGGPEEQARMMEKLKEEYDAMMICREKVAQRGLPMQIVDAEYQWDRRKLTFYFKADKRVDFRELTKENFRIFKSRIWMSMVPKDDPRG